MKNSIEEFESMGIVRAFILCLKISVFMAIAYLLIMLMVGFSAGFIVGFVEGIMA